MRKTIFFLFTILLFTVATTYPQTKAHYISYIINAPSGCTQQALNNIIAEVNKYRSDSKSWMPVYQPEFTLVAAEPDVKGIISLPANPKLMSSANETARKFAEGLYPDLDHSINGQGATMRAIKDGWIPSLNKLFTADITPPFTMLQENFFMGTSGSYLWKNVVDGWKTSPGHNATMLSSGAVSIGCGCADTKELSNGTKNTYWVLLVESEATTTESDEIYNKYFKEGTMYQAKSGMGSKDPGNYKAYEYYELIDGAFDKIKE
ncbi:hypothetical protein BH10BAC5_BH10BAC5_08360 [soil metagenome]